MASSLLRLVAVPLERAGDHVDVLIRLVAHQPVAFEQALHQALDDLRLLLREPAVHDQHVGDDQQVAVGGQHVRLAAAAADHFRHLGLPGHAAGELVLARLDVVQEQIARLEAVLGVDHVQPIRVRRRVEAAERVDRQAGLLRQVADEEIDLGELRRGDRLAFQLVDALDVVAHHDAVGAAREPDLHRHHRVQLPAVRRQHVHRRDRRRNLALVQRRPGLVLADRQLDLEPVVLEEQRVLGRIEPAVGGDQPGVSRVLADLDRDGVVLELERRRRRQLRDLDLHFLDFRRRAVRAGFTRGAGRPAALAAAHAAAHHVDAERDQAGDEQQRDELAECGEARRLLLGHRSGPISFDATGVVCPASGAD